MNLREQLDAQLMWGNEAEAELVETREDARLYNVARKEALAERDAAWAENKRLRVCGNCNHCEMDCGCEFGADTAMCESCVYSPSRWKERSAT